MSVNDTAVGNASDPFWKNSPIFYLTTVAIIAFLTYAIYEDGLNRMVNNWMTRDEYSHGSMIPFIALLMIWQQKNLLERLQFSGSWGGVLLAMAGVLMFVLGELSAITIFYQYGFVVTIAGLLLAYTGFSGFKLIVIPLMLLLFMVPLPGIIFQELSQYLQLVSSALGVGFIRLLNISVNLEGNVIDLGSFKMQVVEACSGLRYLFPLMTLGFIAAYFFKVAFWKRVVVFLSSIPITIFMNSFRIGVIGITVEFWGPGMAEGFLHDFEGWIVFMACTGLLLIEMYILTKIGDSHRSLWQVFGLEFPTEVPDDVSPRTRTIPLTYWVAGGLIVATSVVALTMPPRSEPDFPRKQFSAFPLQIGQWQGATERLEQIFIDALNMDDYLLVNYRDGKGRMIGLYSAFYQSQSKGESIHSPRACLPGGGWEIKEFGQKAVSIPGASELNVNRVLIQQGESKQLVYYWFRMHGRDITDEYLMKWYVFQDAITKNRTDGALIRITTPMDRNEKVEDAESRLAGFLQQIDQQLYDYIPQ